MDRTNDGKAHNNAASTTFAGDDALCGQERRATGERRRTAGLFELRARREGGSGDRRRRQHSGTAARMQALWRLVRQ